MENQMNGTSATLESHRPLSGNGSRSVVRRFPLVLVIMLTAICTIGNTVYAADKSARTIAVIPFIETGRSTGAFASMHTEIARIIEKDTKGQVRCVPDSVIRTMPKLTVDDSRNVDTLAKFAANCNARWLLYVVAYHNESGYSAYLHLNGVLQQYPLFLQYEKIPTLDALRDRIMNDLKFVYFRISASDGYYLHENRSLRMVTEFTDFGFSGDAVTFAYPYSVFSRDGKTLLCAGSSTVCRFDPKGRIIAQYGTRGEGRGEYLSSYRVAEDASGNVITLDSGGKFIIYSKTDASEFRTGQVLNFALTPKGRIVVHDPSTRMLRMYDQKGTLIAEYPTGEDNPSAIATGRKGVLVAFQRDNHLVIRTLDDTGSTISETDTYLRPENASVIAMKDDDRGNIYLLDMIEKKIICVAPDGSVRWVISKFNIYPDTVIGTAMDLAVTPDGKTIYLADTTVKRIIKISQLDNFPEYGSAGEFTASARAIMTKDPERATAYLNAALMIDRNSKEALTLLGSIHEAEGRFDRALMLYQRLVDIDPSDQKSKKSLDRMAASKELVRADRFASLAQNNRAKLGPEAAKVPYDEAAKSYERVLKLDPANTGARGRYDSLRKLFGAGGSETSPVTVESVNMVELFAAMYKYYADNPVGTVTIENTTGMTIDRLTVETEVKNFMDYPTESRPVRAIAPGQKVKVQIFALFNNRILSITEDTPLALKLKIRCKIGDREIESTASGNTTLYNRNALMWNPTSRLASFITTRDNAVKTCARATVQLFRNSRYSFMPQNVQHAIEIFDTLGAYGITYVPDPRTPFASYSKLKDKVDYIQYPRDTLRFKTGDCDDLTSLYCALLENIGIETGFVTVPGHIFMVFNTGVPIERKSEVTIKSDLIIERNGTAWVPVETTLIGRTFTEAWNAGAATIMKYRAGNAFEITETKHAWETYAPVTLDDSAWEPEIPKRDMIDRLFTNDINSLIDRELSPRARDLGARFDKKKDAKNANAMGITYARFDRLAEAEEWFHKALEIDPKFIPARTNLGNVYLLTGRETDAKKMYEISMSLKKTDAKTHLNLAIYYRKKGDAGRAAEEFRTAVDLDPSLEKEYAYLSRKTDSLKAGNDNPIPVWLEQ
jgi:tetratricopeptide (TPR) repeat protein